MSKYRKKSGSGTPEVSTASLPDIVFMLLFFFMTVTVMKDDVLQVANELPNATEIKKLEKKDRLITIYIGEPSEKWKDMVGSEPKIQVGDKFIEVHEVGAYVLGKIEEKLEHIRPFVTVVLKVDRKASMGLVSDVKEELRKVNALKINYITYEGDGFLNLKN